MGVFRILGLVGSASCLVFLIWWVVDKGIPDEPMGWWVFLSLLLVAFNFFPLPKSNDSLLGLWIEEKKSKLRKEINDD